MNDLISSYQKDIPYPLKEFQRVPQGLEHTYVFYNPSNKTYKIGTSKNVRRRRRTIETMSGTELYILLDIELLEGYDERGALIESYLHKFFKDKRLDGEWFNLSVRDIIQIRNLFYEIYGEDILDNTRAILLNKMEDYHE
jgi:hypothetical protein